MQLGKWCLSFHECLLLHVKEEEVFRSGGGGNGEWSQCCVRTGPGQAGKVTWLSSLYGQRAKWTLTEGEKKRMYKVQALCPPAPFVLPSLAPYPPVWVARHSGRCVQGCMFLWCCSSTAFPLVMPQHEHKHNLDLHAKFQANWNLGPSS